MALDKRQKVLLPLVVIAFAYVGWQLYSMLVTQNAPPAPTVSTTKKLVASQQENTQRSTNPTTQQSTATASESSTAATATTATTPPSFNNNRPPAASTATKEQTQYLKLLNQYQLLKMKHMLLDEEVAIASAKQKIADLNNQTSKLGGSVDFSSDIDGMDGSSNDLQANTDAGNYAVVYIDRQNGQWNATLNNRGHFEEATIGSVLSDGSKVVSIDSTGAVLKQGDQMLKLTFSGPVAVNAEDVDTDSDADETPVIAAKKALPLPEKTLAPAQPKIETVSPTPVKSELKALIVAPATSNIKEVAKPIIVPPVVPAKPVIEEKKPVPVVTTKETAKPVMEEKKIAPVIPVTIKEATKPVAAVTTKKTIKPITTTSKTTAPIKSLAKIPTIPTKPVVEEKKPVSVVTTKETTKPIIEEKKSTPVITTKETVKPVTVTPKTITTSNLVKVSPVLTKPVAEEKKLTPVVTTKETIKPAAEEKKIVPATVTTKETTKPVTAIKTPAIEPKKEILPQLKPVVIPKESTKDDLQISLKKPTDIAVTLPAKDAAPKNSDEMKNLLNRLEKENEPKANAPLVTVSEIKDKKAVPIPTISVSKSTTPIVITSSTKPDAKPSVSANVKPVTATNVATLPSASGKPDHYTLQLMGGKDIEDINNFVKANKLEGTATAFKTSRNGTDWYILLYGNYPTSSKAVSAIKGLPVALKTLEPWVKPVFSTTSKKSI